MNSNPPKKPFAKIPADITDLLTHWKQQGLIFSDDERAAHYLKFIGYYRLRGYAWSFQTHTKDPISHRFRDGTTFDMILDLYKFDRKLRTLVMDALERIEVAIRTVTSDLVSVSRGAHWFTEQTNFCNFDAFDSISRKIEETLESSSARSHLFLQHYYQNYSSPTQPPSWMLFELLSFGTVSVLYSKLELRLRKDIAQEFGLTADNMESWSRALSYLRNVCAHHGRLWNKSLTIKPPTGYLREYKIGHNNKFYALASIIHYFLVKIKGASQWSNNLSELLSRHPQVDAHVMGFPTDWHKLPPWRPPSSNSGGL